MSVVIQDQMLSTAQQMLQDSRSKIELIRLQIIKVTQAGSSGSSGDGNNHIDSTHGGQSHRVRSVSEGHSYTVKNRAVIVSNLKTQV